MEYGKTASGQIMVRYQGEWFLLHKRGFVNVTKCDRDSIQQISKLEVILYTGTSVDKILRQLKRHCEIIKRRHELFLKAARTGEEFTSKDIIGSESDE